VGERVAVVTGAANGIGLASVEAFAAAGYRVALLDLDGAAVSDRAAELPEGDRTRVRHRGSGRRGRGVRSHP